MADELLKGLYKFCEEKSKNIKLKAEPQVFVELCNALVELKYLRTAKETMYREIYNKAIDDFETKILGNCASMLKDGERVIVIRTDIFKFILEQLKGGSHDN